MVTRSHAGNARIGHAQPVCALKEKQSTRPLKVPNHRSFSGLFTPHPPVARSPSVDLPPGCSQLDGMVRALGGEYVLPATGGDLIRAQACAEWLADLFSRLEKRLLKNITRVWPCRINSKCCNKNAVGIRHHHGSLFPQSHSRTRGSPCAHACGRRGGRAADGAEHPRA